MRKPVDIVNEKPVATLQAAAAPAAETPEGDLLELVHALMHQYRSLQYRALRDGPHPVTHMDAKVLGFFGSHPGATQRDLVLRSGRDKAQIARLIKVLCDKGLLARADDPGDRRQVRLSLTDAGADVQRSLRRQADRLGALATTGLSPAEQRQLTALLQRVRANLTAAS